MLAKTFLRRATDSDWRAFYGTEPYEGWVGFLAQREGKVVAFAYAWIDVGGRAWTGIDNVSEVPPLLLHRAIADFFMSAARAGIPFLYALCDDRNPKAPRWLSKLGFSIDGTMPKVYIPQLGISSPVWKRILIDGVEL